MIPDLALRHDLPVLSSGFATVDAATGIGGYPRGRITEIFGSPSAGKVALAMACCTCAAQAGLIPVWIDLEHSLGLHLQTDDRSMRDILVAEPACAEEGIDMAAAFLAQIPIDLLVLDSAIVMRPRRQARDTPLNAARAEFVGRSLRKLVPLVAHRQAVLLFLSREYLGAVPAATASIGGSAPAYYASLRLKLTRNALCQQEGELDGYRIIMTVVKNRLAAPYRQAWLRYTVSEGLHGDAAPRSPGPVRIHAAS